MGAQGEWASRVEGRLVSRVNGRRGAARACQANGCGEFDDGVPLATGRTASDALDVRWRGTWNVSPGATR
eukprot:3639642-Prymnesium_polylepis.1